jgi:hypothetical protein
MLGRVMRELVDRAVVDVASPCHAFRRTVATVMDEHGVRTRVIEGIMGWSPRQMHERHYLRLADDAIQTLYWDDPSCESPSHPRTPSRPACLRARRPGSRRSSSGSASAQAERCGVSFDRRGTLLGMVELRVVVSDELAEQLAERARQEHTTPEQLASRAVESLFGAREGAGEGVPGFVALGASGRSDVSERAEEILRADFGA